MYETIRFPTADGDHAIDIAATDDATLHVLSVVDERAFLVLEDGRVERVRDDSAIRTAVPIGLPRT